MEIIYFILGLLTAAVLYGVYLLHNVYKSHAEVIAHNQSVINHAAIEYATVKEEVEKLNQYISSVRESLEKDSYQGIVEVKKELNLVADLAKVTSDNLTQFSKVVEGDLGKQYTRLNDLGNKIKGLSQDPNFLQRYS
jgi:peptidoglycan hydrolase CwlO-like protein